MRVKITALFVLVTILSFGQITKNQEWNFEKKVTFDDSVRITTGATSGYVLTSDTRGIATWQASGSGVIQSATVTLDSADIVSLHSSPVTIVPAQGSNTFIFVIGALYYMQYNSVAYTTDPTLRIQYADGNVINTNNNYLSFSSNAIGRKSTSDLNVSGSNISINSALQVTTPTSNPTSGNSTVKITVLYSVINL